VNPGRSPGFPRYARLLKGRDFQAVFRGTECRSSDRNLALLARRNGLGHARLGMAIAKRRIRTAVARNRIKRLVRESFRQQSLSGLDIVVLARDSARQASNAELVKSLQTHWRRLIKQC
jgi:ribonuclease P protein component